jgi:hypothetical protein
VSLSELGLTFCRANVALVNQGVQIKGFILQLRELRILQIFSRGCLPRQNQLDALVEALGSELRAIQMFHIFQQVRNVARVEDKLERDFAQEYVLLHR